MDLATGSVWHVTVKDRVIALRRALRLTQEQLADRAGWGDQRAYVAKIERGDNKASTVDVRERLARGFGLEFMDLSAYLDGRIELAAALERVKPADTRVEREPTERVPDEGETRLESALFAAMDPAQFTSADFDAARAAIRESHRYEKDHRDPRDLARDFLGAARHLRVHAREVSTIAILAHIATGRLDEMQRAAHDARTAVATRDAGELAEAKGYGSPGDFPPLAGTKKGPKP